ncbi:unnamed protein product [Rotaria sordida]|uniref:Uncharacterized protein n=1 Tax=Rotaria sordida TaxID=392033 RepID=A0A813QMM9_9BILA|nr:unnamed protein product [Rotaria sordida]
MAVELYSKVIARQVATALYPLLANVGTYVLKNLIRAVVNIAIRRPVNIADLQIDKSIFRDLSVLKSDSKDRWNHVFTNKYGHVKPQTDEERGVVALALEMVRKLGERVPILSKAAEPFKRKFELYFKDSNVRMWVRECRQGDSDNYYIESGGMYIDCKADPNELDTGGELLKIL